MPVARRNETPSRLSSPAAPDVIGLFAERNPDIDRAEVEAMGTLVAEFGATAAKLSPAARSVLFARRDEIGKLVTSIVEQRSEARPPLKLVARTRSEISTGEGLGRRLAPEDGRARLDAYATTTRIEDWAGPVAGPTELMRRFGLARSTLHAWQTRGAVIALLAGVRKHAFPLEQFVDGRPIAGLAPILDAIGDPRVAWSWLREANAGLSDATPLAVLELGRRDEVLETARSDFGRQ